MNENIDIKKLASSWTKYDIVKLIDITAENDLEPYISGLKAIDTPVLKGFLGIKNIYDDLPRFWMEIQNILNKLGYLLLWQQYPRITLCLNY